MDGFSYEILEALRSWNGLYSLASTSDPHKRLVAIFFSTPLLESRLSKLGILGFGEDQVVSVTKAVRIAEQRYYLDRAVVSSGIMAIKDRNKIAHNDPDALGLGASASVSANALDDEEESIDSIEVIVNRATRIVRQLRALDAEIGRGVVERRARERALRAEMERRSREAEEQRRIEAAEAEERRKAAKWKREQEELAQNRAQYIQMVAESRRQIAASESASKGLIIKIFGGGAIIAYLLSRVGMC